MMNGVTGIGVNNSNYQMAFRAKGSKAAYEAIDLASDMAKEFTRPIAEKKENFIRRSVSKFLETFKKEQKNNKLIEQINKAHMQVHLEELKATDSELYKATLQRMAEERVATMTTWEMLKDVVSNILKKL